MNDIEEKTAQILSTKRIYTFDTRNIEPLSNEKISVIYSKIQVQNSHLNVFITVPTSFASHEMRRYEMTIAKYVMIFILP